MRLEQIVPERLFTFQTNRLMPEIDAYLSTVYGKLDGDSDSDRDLWHISSGNIDSELAIACAAACRECGDPWALPYLPGLWQGAGNTHRRLAEATSLRQ